MKFSTLLTSDYSWTAATLYDSAGTAIAAQNSHSISVLYIINASASDRVFRVNKGAPFLVKAGNTFTYDVAANKATKGQLKVEMDSATFTDITIFGE